MNSSPSSVLAIVAHPDDLEIQCAGTIAKWVASYQTRVTAVICSSGEKGNRRKRQYQPFELAIVREKEQLEAASVIGISKVVFLRYPDGGIPYDRALKAEIAHLIRYYKPELVLTHDPWRYLQLHPDHRTVGYSVIDAIGLAREYDFLPVLDALEVAPFALSELWLFRSDDPNHFEDIGESLEKKLQALQYYTSQLDPWDEWKARIIDRAREAGQHCGAEFAEPFQVFSF